MTPLTYFKDVRKSAVWIHALLSNDQKKDKKKYSFKFQVVLRTKITKT